MNLPDSTKIQEVQNEDENLMIQSAAGHYFNLAEYLNYGCWILCVLSAIISLKSDDTVIAVMMVVMDVLATICGIMMEKYMDYAAVLRRLFDLRVILGDDKDVEHSEKRRLKELVLRYSEKYRKSCQLDMQNAGDDKPPGKRNWYEFTVALENPEAQVECLEQNKWWDKKLTQYRNVAIVLLQMVVVAAAFLLLFYYRGIPVAAIVNAAAIIVFRYGERLRSEIKRYSATIRTDTALDIVREHPTVYGIKKCMGYVDEYRHIPIFSISILHKHSAGQLTRVYRHISSE